MNPANNSKLVVISGGSKGIGRALVDKFYNAGFTIATCSRNINELESLKSELDLEKRLHIFQADLANKSDVCAFADYVLSLNLPIQVLINNAGKFLPGEVHLEEEGVLESQIETNLYSAYYLTRHLIENIKSQKSSHIFNVCSIASLIAYANGGSYTISKFALYGFSKALREEMKNHHVKVTSVLPGATLTSSWDGVDIPEERFIPAEDVAALMFNCFEVSDRTVVEDLLIRPQLGDI
ncbi:SDR family oxidoreductase [Sessilibacter sp. MAH1]